jgi:hypothetical protein
MSRIDRAAVVAGFENDLLLHNPNARRPAPVAFRLCPARLGQWISASPHGRTTGASHAESCVTHVRIDILGSFVDGTLCIAKEPLSSRIGNKVQRGGVEARH